MKFISPVSVALFAAVSVVSASPVTVERSAQDVWAPKVTFPIAGAAFVVGNSYTFLWDTSDAPAQITNKFGAVILRKADLSTPVVLAGNFPITDGAVNVTIPWVLSGSDYSVTLFGDSGNFSPTFSISGPSPF